VVGCVHVHVVGEGNAKDPHAFCRDEAAPK
jgi:hypothetical protein